METTKQTSFTKFSYKTEKYLWLIFIVFIINLFFSLSNVNKVNSIIKEATPLQTFDIGIKNSFEWRTKEQQTSDFIVKERKLLNESNIIINLLYRFGVLVSIILFIKWFRNSYSTLIKEEIINTKMSLKRVTSIWFIPIINLWKPFLIFKLMYSNLKSKYATKHGGGIIKANILIFYFWWLSILFYFLIITIFIILVFFYNSFLSTNIDNYINVYNIDVYLTFLGDFVIVIVIGLTTRIINKVSFYYENILTQAC